MSAFAKAPRLPRDHRIDRIPPDDTPTLTVRGVLVMAVLIALGMFGATWLANAGAAALDALGGAR